ncbi:bitter taste receptor 14 [Xenopus tropicalis]|uniref:Taste receptor type 2 n=1 Tax=Xenopus tropicalis TaxID=8364 RepID=Q2AB68_XENTR|nr:bitter taste receptor 14 [Xenopus tropicalis]BAE80399.1 bitter taste receptor [Xenopus tropicalis]|eukprot:NP_001165529.1 bitter taste receptor 14 [Xenopus tropicalis]
MDFTTVDIVELVVSFIQFLFGITINGFIMGTFSMQWRRNKSLQASDTVLMFLSTTRFFWQWVLSLMILYNYITFSLDFLQLLTYISNFLELSSLWLTFTLCFTYCVKITDHPNSLFIYVKLRVSMLVKWMLLASLLASLAFTLLLRFSWDIFSTDTDPRNSTETNGTPSSELLVCYMGAVPPFLIFCLTLLLFIYSFWIFIHRFKRSRTGFESPVLSDHLKVLKKIFFALFLYVMYFISSGLFLFKRQQMAHWERWLFIIYQFYPTAYLGWLILLNCRLKTVFLSIYQRALRLIRNKSQITQTQRAV